MTPGHNHKAIHIGTGEFAFCSGARTPAEARPPRGFRDLGNVEVYKIETRVDRFERDGVYRGRRIIDASFATSIGFNYLFRCDELTKDNLRLLTLGAAAGDNSRGAYDDVAADAFPFTAAQPNQAHTWYDLLLGGEEVTHLTSVRLALAGGRLTDDTGIPITTSEGEHILLDEDSLGEPLIEGEHYVVDLTVGRVRFLQRFTQSVFPFLTAAAITPASADYMEAIAPFASSRDSGMSLRGIGRFLGFRALDETLAFDHRGFSCLLATAGLAEQTGRAPAPFDLAVRVTHQRGSFWVRAQTEPFPDAFSITAVLTDSEGSALLTSDAEQILVDL